MIAVQISCLAVIAVLNFSRLLGIDNNTNSIGTIVAGLVFTTLHGRMAMGWKNLAVFAAITAAVSFSSEAIGVATGWIFGSYYYTDHLGPKVLGVPVFIQAAYVTMCYASLMTARVILDALRTPRGRGVVSAALGGAFLMVSWDVSMDPHQSTVSGDWIWREGGAYFGVPIHNYVGWFGTVFVLMLLYMSYERAHPLPEPSGPAAKRWFWSQPVINYALIAIGIIIVPFLGGIIEPIASPQNYSGSPSHLANTLSLVTVFTMGIPVALALARLFAPTRA